MQRRDIAIILVILAVLALFGYYYGGGGDEDEFPHGCTDLFTYTGVFEEVESPELGFKVHCGSGVAQGEWLPPNIWVKLNNMNSGVEVIFGGCGIKFSYKGVFLCTYDASGKLIECPAVIGGNSFVYNVGVDSYVDQDTLKGICVVYDRYIKCIECTISEPGTAYISNACFSGYVCFV